MEGHIPEAFGFVVTAEEARTIVYLTGELDMASAPSFTEAFDSLQHDDTAEIVVDLRGLTFLDSTGLATLLKASMAANESHRQMSFVRGVPSVHQVFEITRMAERVNWTDLPD